MEHGEEIETLRASEMDDLIECAPGVLTDGAIELRSAGDPAKLGKIVHTLAASFVEHGRYDVKTVCNRHGWDDEDEVERLAFYAAKAWSELRRFFPPKIACERVVKGRHIFNVNGRSYQLAGTIDVCGPFLDKPHKVIFADWKSGRVDGGYENQMLCYAWLLWDFMGRPDDIDITGVVVFLRHGYFRTVKYDADSLKKWEFDLLHNVLSKPNVYRPGGHCANCPIRYSCAARAEMTNGATTALLLPNHLPDSDPHKMTIRKGIDILKAITADNKNQPEVQEVVAKALSVRRNLEKALDDLGDVLREAVRRAGPLPTGDGYALVLREFEQEQVSDPVKAHQVLKRHLSDAEILNACRMSLPKLRAAKAAKYTRGEKKDARESMEKDLKEAGAVSVTTRERLEELDLSGQELPDGTAKPSVNVLPDGQADPRCLPGAEPSDPKRQLAQGGGGTGAA